MRAWNSPTWTSSSSRRHAVQLLACTSSWGLKSDDARLSVRGSGISLGHPVGATGARILATLGRGMQRRQARYGLETMCICGGQGLAAAFELPDTDGGRVTIGAAEMDRAGFWRDRLGFLLALSGSMIVGR